MKTLSGNIIIVGASSGIGRAVAAIFAEKGWKVGVCARRFDSLQALHSHFPDNVSCCQLDVTAEDSADVFTQFIQDFGGTDVILYAAGCGWNNPMLNAEEDERTVKTNVVGFTRVVNAAFDWFATRGAVNKKKPLLCAITSIAGTKGLGISATYSASKGYQNIYLEALSQLTAIRRINLDITDIRPGFVDTALLNSAQHKYPLLMNVDKVARKIVRAVEKRKKVVYIDWKWHIVVVLWRLIPRWMWIRLKVSN